jgi:hypothetical protein
LIRESFKDQKKAAIKIQKAWRLYVKKRILETELQLKKETNTVQQLKLYHQQRLKTKEKELAFLNSLHPNEVDPWIKFQRDKAAVQLQSIWRGRSSRTKFKHKLLERERIKVLHRAATVIQRAFLIFKNKNRVPFVELIQKYREPKILNEERFFFDR